MARNPDKNKELNEASELLLEAFIKKLTDVLNSDEVTAADLGVIRQFLKDNAIGVDPIKDADALDNLIDSLGKKRAGLPPLPTTENKTTLN